MSDSAEMSNMWAIPKDLVNPTFFTIAHLEDHVRDDEQVAAHVLKALSMVGGTEVDALEGVGKIVDIETLRTYLSKLRDLWNNQRELGEFAPD